ncbi:MAG TPA: sialidase family protein, partial [Ferruginibacter sp.]|nr:sialidase family protein [Ferruginibacter sp.]
KTFHLGESLNMPGSNESMATELSGGRLMMNSRNQKGDIRARIIGISSNGGITWDTTYFDLNLPDPVCQASILTLGKRKPACRTGRKKTYWHFAMLPMKKREIT